MTVIGFTRPKDRIKDSVKEAEDMGFTVMVAPSLEIFTGDDEEFDKLTSSLIPGCIVIFGSATAVEQCQKRYGDSLKGMFDGMRMVSIGPATTKKLESVGLKVDSIPDDYSSYGLVDLLKGDVLGKRVVVIRSDSGSDVL